MTPSEARVVSLAGAVEAARRARERGARVVFANGCFDLLHVGHVRYLEGARAEGDVLIVGVNSDASVRRLKGPGRPLLDEGSRALLVACLEVVSQVVVFDGQDVRELLRAIRPHVHAKGTDYSVDTVPEGDTAREIGARIAITGDRKEHSTRELLARLARGSGG